MNSIVKELLHLNKYFVKYKNRLIIGIVITVMSNILAVNVPPFIRQSLDVVDEFHKGSGLELAEVKYQLLINILWIIGLALAAGVFGFLMRQALIVMSRLIEFDLKNEIYAQYQRLSIAFYKRNRTGDLMNRITEDVNRVRMYLGPSIMFSVNMIVLFIVTLVNMLRIDKTLTLYTLIPLPILSLIIFILSKIINERSRIVQEHLSKLTAFTQEMFSGIGVLKAYAIEHQIEREFDHLATHNQNRNIHLYQSQALFFPMMILLIGISNIIVIYIGGLRYINGQMTLGVIAEFIMYVNMLTWPVATLGWVTAIVQQAEASQKRINAFLKEEPEIISTSDEKFDFKGNVVFDDVTFSYNDNKLNALNHINFNLNQGETLGIMGKTGSGKSTVAALLTRLYDPNSGTIFIDDHDIKTIDLEFLRSHIGIVPQDVFLFSDTIENNLKIGCENCTYEQIVEACEKAAIHDTILSFNKGYQTIIGERGVTLSGGQKQRLALARALLKQPEIFILDDSLSALDTQTEADILNYFQKNKSKQTTIIISHRVSGVQHADKIIVLDNSTIVQQGTHSELIEQEGYYRYLYEQQHLQNNT